MMRRIHWVTMVVVALLIGADVAYWRIVAGEVRAGFQGWAETARAQGWEVNAGPLSIGGFPIAASVTVPNLSVRHAGPSIPGDVELASAGITLSIALFRPTALNVAMTGPLHIRIDGSADTILTARTLDMSVPLRRDASVFGDLLARDVRLEQAAGAWHVTIGYLSAHIEVAAGAFAGGPDAPQKPVRVVAAGEGIILPPTLKWALGPTISSLSFDGELNGRLPTSSNVTDWATAWRDGGGSLEVSHFAMGWGPLGLSSSATVALDDQLQPMGSGSAKLVGYADTLSRLASAGVLTRSAATAATAVLSLMAGTSDGDEPTSVEVPLTLQYRTLSIRQVPLVRLPELDWPPR